MKKLIQIVTNGLKFPPINQDFETIEEALGAFVVNVTLVESLNFN